MIAKKNKLGFGPKTKPRTHDEINVDYNTHAAQVGHKVRVISQLEDEIRVHTSRMVAISKEADMLTKLREAKANADATPPEAETV